MTITHTIIESPLGPLTLIARDGTLGGVSFRGHGARPGFGTRSDDGFAAVRRQLDQYFAGERTAFDLPTAAAGAAFDRRVWALVDRIPYGQTAAYGELARALGDASRARDVGAAVGRNPLAIVRPCHRVVGADGRLTGYAGGLARKRALLELEQGVTRLVMAA
jgi:methylated-DNA-[protein]-cysteine S-methyltransferase